MTPEEIKELQEDLRVGGILIAKLTDQCRELEAQLAKVQKEEDCPTCGGLGYYYPLGSGKSGPNKTCLKCDGTGKAQNRPDRVKIAKCLWDELKEERGKCDWEVANKYERGTFYIWADQLLALYPDVEELLREARQEVWTRYRSGHLTEKSIAVEQFKDLMENTLRDFSHQKREAGHPASYWAGYHYARGLVMATLKEQE